MKKNMLSSIFGCGLILISLFLLAACQPTEKVAAALTEEGSMNAVYSADRKFFMGNYLHAAPQASTNDANVQRWVAMGSYYTALSSKRAASAAAANQARWEALGDYYLIHIGERPLRANQADQARWTAIGEFYNQPDAFITLSKSTG
jgi:hypothetical protein